MTFAGEPSTTPPAQLLQPGRSVTGSAQLAAHQQANKLNTPTKQTPGGSLAPAAQTAGSLASAQTHTTAGRTTAGASVYDFPDSDDDEDMQRSRAASMAVLVPAGSNRSGAQQSAKGAAASLYPAPPVQARRPNTAVESAERTKQQQGRGMYAFLEQKGVDAKKHATTPAAASKPDSAAGVQAQQASNKAMSKGQLDIRQFTRTRTVQPSSSCVSLPAGMLNQGNTCYLNAILQVRQG